MKYYRPNITKHNARLHRGEVLPDINCRPRTFVPADHGTDEKPDIIIRFDDKGSYSFYPQTDLGKAVFHRALEHYRDFNISLLDSITHSEANYEYEQYKY